MQELLADLLYYYEAGKVYCARDYAAKANIPRCGACDELIFAAEYTGGRMMNYSLVRNSLSQILTFDNDAEEKLSPSKNASLSLLQARRTRPGI